MDNKIKLDSGNIKLMLRRQNIQKNNANNGQTESKTVIDEQRSVTAENEQKKSANEKIIYSDIKNLNTDGVQSVVETEDVQKAIAEAIKTEEDILLEPVGDRRILPNVPDKNRTRTNIDRRGIVYKDDAVSNYEKAEKKKKRESGMLSIIL